jgi:hypothetical protein
MVVLAAEDPAEELHRVCTALDLSPRADPFFVTGYEATGRDFDDLGIGSFGRCVVIVAPEAQLALHGPVLDGSPLALSFFASENRGGANQLEIYAHGRQVGEWDEWGAGTGGELHPLLQGLPDDLHPFDRIARVVERVLGATPVDVLHRPLFWMNALR